MCPSFLHFLLFFVRDYVPSYQYQCRINVLINSNVNLSLFPSGVVSKQPKIDNLLQIWDLATLQKGSQQEIIKCAIFFTTTDR